MTLRCCTLLAALILASSGFSQIKTPQVVITEEGKRVVLKPSGVWELEEPQKSVSDTVVAPLLSLLEVQSDKIRYVDRPLRIKGKLSLGSEYFGSFRNSQDAYLSFQLSSDYKIAYVYAQRGPAAERIRQRLLENGGSVFGTANLLIRQQTFQANGIFSSVIADLLDFQVDGAPSGILVPNTDKTNNEAPDVNRSTSKQTVSVFIKDGQPYGGDLVSISETEIKVRVNEGTIKTIPLSSVKSYLVFDGEGSREYIPPISTSQSRVVSESPNNKEQSKPQIDLRSIDASATAINSLIKISDAINLGANMIQYRQLVLDAQQAVRRSNSVLPEGEVKGEINSALNDYIFYLKLWDAFGGGVNVDAKSDWGEILQAKYFMKPQKALFTKFFVAHDIFVTVTGAAKAHTDYALGAHNKIIERLKSQN